MVNLHLYHYFQQKFIHGFLFFKNYQFIIKYYRMKSHSKYNHGYEIYPGALSVKPFRSWIEISRLVFPN